MEKINENAKKLFDEIYGYVEKGEDAEDIFTSDLYEDVQKNFRKFIGQGINGELNKELTKVSFERVEEKNKNFFENEYNKIYLKLLSLYSKIIKNNKEDETLYYVISKFAFTQETSKNVSKIISDFRTIDEEFISKIIKEIDKQMDVKNTILKPYEEASKYGENQYINHKNLEDSIDEEDEELSEEYYEKLENIEETNNVIDCVINYPYADILEENEEDYLKEEIFQKFTISDLAIAYCDKYGNGFTKEERVILQSELTEKETEYLSSSIRGHSH